RCPHPPGGHRSQLLSLSTGNRPNPLSARFVLSKPAMTKLHISLSWIAVLYAMGCGVSDMQGPAAGEADAGITQQCTATGPSLKHEQPEPGQPLLAEVHDAEGLLEPPVVFYATGPVPDRLLLQTMTQLPMTLQSGDMVQGSWSAELPANQIVHYVIVARGSSDDGCLRATQAPVTGAYVIEQQGVETPASCAPCFAD